MEELIIQIQVLLLQIEETQPLKATALITLTEDQAVPLRPTEATTVVATTIHLEVIQHQALHLPVPIIVVEAAAEA